MVYVAVNGAIHFVHSFGCALFIFKEEFEMKLKKAVLLLVAMVLIAATTMSMSSCGLLFRSLLGDGDEEEAGKDSEVLDFIGSNENNESRI